ncbi:MAG: glutamate--tRNA ligase [bacterium]|nr:glutamate--tRNA ligase [bacterium]
MAKVKTRIAPSPTGYLHIGTARTALFNYLFARKNGGEFIVRIEDTDKARSTKEFEENILTGLAALGLQHDGEITYQSKRTEIYKTKLEALITSGKAYISEETEGESKEVIRLKNPGSKITFTDLIHGEITFDTAELKDFVIAKSLEEPLFHLAVVIDDAEMGITHVIRGEDHISNTARQILIQEALGYGRPEYAHIPLILAPDRSKLSKRHGATAVSDYLNLGYLPAALVNFMALLGWSPQAGGEGTDEEVFTLDQLVERFSLDAIQKGGAIFNLDKLNWLNREHLRRLSPEEQTNYIAQALPNLDQNILAKITSLILDKAANWDEIKKLETEGELAYFFEAPTPSKELLKTTEHLPKVIELLEKIDEADWNAENIKNAIWDFASEVGRGDVLWPMRVALSGREKSPDPFTLASILGKEKTIKRLKSVI